jgi:hypothetical protein
LETGESHPGDDLATLVSDIVVAYFSAMLPALSETVTYIELSETTPVFNIEWYYVAIDHSVVTYL